MFRIKVLKTDPISLLYCLFTFSHGMFYLLIKEMKKIDSVQKMIVNFLKQLPDLKAYFSLNSRQIQKGWRRNYPKSWRVWSQIPVVTVHLMGDESPSVVLRGTIYLWTGLHDYAKHTATVFCLTQASVISKKKSLCLKTYTCHITKNNWSIHNL